MNWNKSTYLSTILPQGVVERLGGVRKFPVGEEEEKKGWEPLLYIIYEKV